MEERPGGGKCDGRTAHGECVIRVVVVRAVRGRSRFNAQCKK